MTTLCQSVQYGNYIFSELLNSKVVVNPIYNEDNISIKYYEHVLTITAVVVENPNQQDARGVVSVDDEMDYLKSILSAPRKNLTFTYRGFGTKTYPASEDAAFGPVPQIIEWEPLGSNHVAKVVWSVKFHVLPCNWIQSSGASLFQIISLVEEVDVTFDEEGTMVITTTGTLEVASKNQAVVLTRQNLIAFTRNFTPQNLSVFFARTRKFTIRKDNRTIDYTITDTEIPSDNPFAPNIITQDVSHEISSSLMSTNPYEGMGFITWLNEMTGSFTVRPGVWKGWAWLAFVIYLENRRKRAASWNKPLTDFAKDPKDAKTDDIITETGNNKKKLERWQLPLFVKIKESLNSRKVDITVKWVTHCTLSALFEATGMFKPVDTIWNGVPIGRTPGSVGKTIGEPSSNPAIPKSDVDQWYQWSGTRVSDQISYPTRSPILSNVSFIFDPCTTSVPEAVQSSRALAPSLASGGNPYRERAQSNDDGTTEAIKTSSQDAQLQPSANSAYMSRLSPRNSWVNYRPKVKIIEEVNSTYLPVVTVSAVNTRLATNAQSDASGRDRVGFSINGKTEPTGITGEYAADLIQVRGKPTYRVHFVGSAIRVGWPIPCPVLKAVNEDKDCYRIGVAEFIHEQISASNEIPVYKASWSIEYAVKGDPSKQAITFDGSGSPAEFA